MTRVATLSHDPVRLQLAFDTLSKAIDQRPPATAAVLAVADHTHVIACEAFSSSSAQTPITTDSLFCLASITKPILATAVMQLVEDGLLTLHQPITYYLPEFDRPGKPPLTAWHLLTHTSGIGEIDWATTLRQRPKRAVGYDIACDYHLEFWPGTQFRYSTLSFYELAERVTRLSGISYQEYLQQRIFSPLGMTSTSFDPRNHASDRMVRVEGMTADLPVSYEEARDYNISLCMPGAGLWSSANDLLRFGQALLHTTMSRNMTPHLLSVAHLDLMTREHTSGVTRLENGYPQAVHYGLAWRKGHLNGNETLPGSPSVFEHDGATGGQLWIDPEWDLVFVFLTNAFGADSTVRYGALQTVYSALHYSS